MRAGRDVERQESRPNGPKKKQISHEYDCCPNTTVCLHRFEQSGYISAAALEAYSEQARSPRYVSILIIMCTVGMAPEIGSGWEANIARLINQANETLSSSAHSRRQQTSPYRGSRPPSPLRHPPPTTFRGDRGASYRRDSTGWDASLLSRSGNGGYSDGYAGPGSSPTKTRPHSSSNTPPAAPATFSRLTEARVNDARMDGMEDRVRLEVQTVVRRDVSTL